MVILPLLVLASTTALAAALEQTVVDSSPRRLIALSETERAYFTEREVEDVLIPSGRRFVDVTDWDDSVHSEPPRNRSLERYIKRELYPHVSVAEMEGFLRTFSSFHTRYYKSDTGLQSAKWLHAQLEDLVPKEGGDGAISIHKFAHSWGQFSLIVRFKVKDEQEGEKPRGAVIVGAHQDSVNQFLPWFGRSPGADDDGSGTTSTFHALRALARTGFRPARRPLEFHFYSAEEGGLLGSQAVVRAYVEAGTPVHAFIQMDMTGYTPPRQKSVVGVGIDNVDPALSSYVRDLVQVYSDIKAVDTKCGYGCSDHASWHKAGVAAAFAFENTFENMNPDVHTASDVVENLDFQQMREYSKVAIAFAVELSSL